MVKEITFNDCVCTLCNQHERRDEWTVHTETDTQTGRETHSHRDGICSEICINYTHSELFLTHFTATFNLCLCAPADSRRHEVIRTRAHTHAHRRSEVSTCICISVFHAFASEPFVQWTQIQSEQEGNYKKERERERDNVKTLTWRDSELMSRSRSQRESSRSVSFSSVYILKDVILTHIKELKWESAFKMKQLQRIARRHIFNKVEYCECYNCE